MTSFTALDRICYGLQGYRAAVGYKEIPMVTENKYRLMFVDILVLVIRLFFPCHLF